MTTRTASLTVLTPIVPGQEQPLEDCLQGLGGAAGPSPLSRVPGTHFARWVVVPDFVADPAQPYRDSLQWKYLLFTSNLDGPVEEYLTGLCEGLAPVADSIWGRCVGCPTPAAGPALAAYLLHNRIADGLFFAAYPGTSLAEVLHSLDVRERMTRLALDAQGRDAAWVRSAFLAEFAP